MQFGSNPVIILLVNATHVAMKLRRCIMRSRNQIMMKQMEEFIDDYYMTYHTTPKLQEIADNFHTVKSTVSRYLTEIRY